MLERARYLIVDGHSVIFAWPELRKLQERRSSVAREALIKRLRDYQDWTGMRVVVVFDGKGAHVVPKVFPQRRSVDLCKKLARAPSGSHE